MRRIPGLPCIATEAKRLGVSRNHLRLVLLGERKGREGLTDNFNRMADNLASGRAERAAKLNAKEGA